MIYFSDQMERWFDRAQKCYVLENADFYLFPLRQSRGEPKYYQQLEVFLREHPKIEVTSYRTVKEGKVKISRPCELRIDWSCLLYYRPFVGLLKKEIHEWKNTLKKVNLEGFIHTHYADCLRDPKITLACINIFCFLLGRGPTEAWLLPRQLPHTESTKLIGKDSLLLKLFNYWRQEEGGWGDFFRRFRILRRAAEFRIYAPYCHVQSAQLRDFHSVISADWHSQYNFKTLEQTLIVENYESFQALCPLAKKTLLIFGSGWKASQFVDFRHIFPRPIYYWGDMDKEGYEIFSFLSNRIEEIEPLLMDKKSFKENEKLAVKKEAFFGPFKQVPFLQEPYEQVCKSGLMIEQEKIDLSKFPIEL